MYFLMFLLYTYLGEINKILWDSAYDRAAIKFRGVDADINFDIEDYVEDLKQVKY